MKSIGSFQITGMTISGFKCYEEAAHLTFGNPTVITGGNGRGKSSIADAIAFAVTGLPFFGERGIDRLHCETNPNLMVAMYFVDGEGQNHELTRTRQKSRMTITYDGYEIRQHDLNEMFGEKDVFLSIFNPLYFIEELGDDGKKLLERHLPAISHEQVLAALSESVRASLENESILSPETYLKRRREEIRDLEQNVIYLNGQKDLLDTQRASGAENLRALQDRRDTLVRERDALEEKRFAGLDLAGMQERLVELSARYDEMAKDGAGGVDTTEIDRGSRNSIANWASGAPSSTHPSTPGTSRRPPPRSRNWAPSTAGRRRFSRASSQGSSAPPAAARCLKQTWAMCRPGSGSPWRRSRRKAGRRKGSWTNCRRWKSRPRRLSCSFRGTMWRRSAWRSRN